MDRRIILDAVSQCSLTHSDADFLNVQKVLSNSTGVKIQKISIPGLISSKQKTGKEIDTSDSLNLMTEIYGTEIDELRNSESFSGTPMQMENIRDILLSLNSPKK